MRSPALVNLWADLPPPSKDSLRVPSYSAWELRLQPLGMRKSAKILPQEGNGPKPEVARWEPLSGEWGS